MKDDRQAVTAPVIAIIGASYAGLSLANTLQQQQNSSSSSPLAFTIFESKTLPFTYVMGGDSFNVPSFPSIAKKLQLNMTNKSFDDGLTRQDVMESLLGPVRHQVIAGARIERIEEQNDGFYLHVIQKLKTNDMDLTSTNNNTEIHGPYQCVVGADGVLSKCRTTALGGTFLIGDARWVNDRWFDLGLRRIQRGADIAIMDGVELGEHFLRVASHRNADTDCITYFLSSQSFSSEVNSKFCARHIHIARRKRITSIMIVLLAMVFMKNQYVLTNFFLSWKEQLYSDVEKYARKHHIDVA